MVQEHFLGQRSALAQAQQLKHRIFLARKVHAAAVDFNGFAVEVHRQLARADNGLRMAFGTAHNRVDARDQFFAMKRLCYIIIGPKAKGSDLGVHLANA